MRSWEVIQNPAVHLQRRVNPSFCVFSDLLKTCFLMSDPRTTNPRIQLEMTSSQNVPLCTAPYVIRFIKIIFIFFYFSSQIVVSDQSKLFSTDPNKRMDDCAYYNYFWVKEKTTSAGHVLLVYILDTWCKQIFGKINEYQGLILGNWFKQHRIYTVCKG